jgi:hypothetical protein
MGRLQGLVTLGNGKIMGGLQRFLCLYGKVFHGWGFETVRFKSDAEAIFTRNLIVITSK